MEAKELDRALNIFMKEVKSRLSENFEKVENIEYSDIVVELFEVAEEFIKEYENWGDDIFRDIDDFI